MQGSTISLQTPSRACSHRRIVFTIPHQTQQHFLHSMLLSLNHCSTTCEYCGMRGRNIMCWHQAEPVCTGALSTPSLLPRCSGSFTASCSLCISEIPWWCRLRCFSLFLSACTALPPALRCHRLNLRVARRSCVFDSSKGPVTGQPYACALYACTLYAFHAKLAAWGAHRNSPRVTLSCRWFHPIAAFGRPGSRLRDVQTYVPCFI